MAREAAFTLPDETRQSLPIPVFSKAGGKIVFLFCPQHIIPREGALLSAPTHELEFDWKAKKTEGLRKFNDMSDIERRKHASASQALHKMPPGMSLNEYDKKDEELNQLFDELIPVYFKQVEAMADLPEKCCSFLSIFREISEKPLVLYYETVGKDYFDWLQKNARTSRVGPGRIALVQIAELARASYAKALDHIPENYRRSFPIPILKNKKVYLTFFYYQSTIRYKMSAIIFAPTWMQTVDCETGDILEWRKAASDEFGRNLNTGQVGELSLPPNMTADQFREAEQELYKTLENLLPAFQAWNIKTDPDKENIKKFSGLFAAISEPPLRPYYEMLGYNFFHWLKN
jgi:hypothetical protein